MIRSEIKDQKGLDLLFPHVFRQGDPVDLNSPPSEIDLAVSVFSMWPKAQPDAPHV